MINLQLAIYEGDAQLITFNNVTELIDYIKELKSFDFVWLVTDRKTDEILITENIEQIIKCILFDFWDLSFDKDSDFYIQEYQSYEDAYEVALYMKEENPKCYS